jgi:hypothetical protein
VNIVRRLGMSARVMPTKDEFSLLAAGMRT